MPQEHVVSIDPSKPLSEEPGTGHNRWHEDIEPVVEVDPGDTVVYETRDAFDGQLNGESTAEDVENLDLSVVHPLTGPVFVKGAEPGDLLEVKLVAVEADPWEQWGYTVEVPGFGFLRDDFPEPYIIHWRLHGNEYAESEQLPGVRIRCNPHPGVLGLAPSAELRQRATEREGALAERDGREYRHQANLAGHHRPFAGVRGGRAGLDRGCPLRSGRLRGLRDGDRGEDSRAFALWDQEGRGRAAGHPGPAVLPGRLLHGAGAGRPAPLFRHHRHRGAQRRHERE